MAAGLGGGEAQDPRRVGGVGWRSGRSGPEGAYHSIHFRHVASTARLSTAACGGLMAQSHPRLQSGHRWMARGRGQPACADRSPRQLAGCTHRLAGFAPGGACQVPRQEMAGRNGKRAGRVQAGKHGQTLHMAAALAAAAPAAGVPLPYKQPRRAAAAAPASSCMLARQYGSCRRAAHRRRARARHYASRPAILCAHLHAHTLGHRQAALRRAQGWGGRGLDGPAPFLPPASLQLHSTYAICHTPGHTGACSAGAAAHLDAGGVLWAACCAAAH